MSCNDATTNTTTLQGCGDIGFSLDAEEVQAVGSPMVRNVREDNDESASWYKTKAVGDRG